MQDHPPRPGLRAASPRSPQVSALIPRGREDRAAFSLIELLVVVAVIAVLTSLMVPALPGLLGVGGRQGGVNLMSVALEQARLSAMQSGVTAYVGFPIAAADTNAAYSSVIVFRDATDEEKQEQAGAIYKPVTKWLRLPQGIYYEAGDGFEDGATNLTGIPAGGLPKLGGQSLAQIVAIPFDRFGKLGRGNSPVKILLGEKASPTSAFIRGADMHTEFTIQPLTGRVKVIDKSGSQAP